MAADDRALRDQMEKLQVRVKALQAQLADQNRLHEVRAEVAGQLTALRREHAERVQRLALLRPQVEEARQASLRVKRERAERRVAEDVGTAARVGSTLVISGIAAAVGLQVGGALHLGALAGVGCFAGAAGFLTLIWRMAADLKR